MADIFFTSDTHFGHANILKYCKRPWASVEEMNEGLIENWNSVVKQGDKVYHLGDVMFGDKTSFQKLWPRLNGSKRLVVGNHDDVKWLSSGGFFQKVMLWRKFDNFVFTHVPVHPSTLGEDRFDGRAVVNVHGHTHETGSPEGPYRSVCVEMTNYTPVHYEEL